MAIFDANQPMSFAGRQFPFERYEVHGAARKHVHEYPHSPGGAPEKLGRSLYEITVRGLFDANLTPKVYKDLWPTGLAFIRHLYEIQQTDDLVIPTIGVLPAFIDDFRQTSSNMHLSGEWVDLKFLEDSSAAFVASQIAVPSTGAIVEAGEYFREQTSPLKIPLLQAIELLFADVIAYRDTLGMFSAVFEAKLLGLLRMCNEADIMVKELQDPANLLGKDALMALWQSAVRVRNDTQEIGSEMSYYVTRTTMSVSDISIAIYGDSSHAGDVLALNGFEDPFAVPAGTRVKYYPNSVGQQAA
jgi:hypothetical protein